MTIAHEALIVASSPFSSMLRIKVMSRKMKNKKNRIQVWIKKGVFKRKCIKNFGIKSGNQFLIHVTSVFTEREKAWSIISKIF